MNLRDTYNKIAKDWYKDHSSDTWWFGGTNAFVSLLQPGATVLDVGCGAGVKSRFLVEKGLTVTGIDFSEEFIKLAQQDTPNANFHVLDMKDVGQLGKNFDGVFAQASLLHVPKKEILSMMKTLLSVLSLDGYFYVAVKGIRPDRNEEHVLEENDYGYTYRRFFSYFTMEELMGYMKQLGMDVVFQKNERVGKTDWLQIIGRK